MRVALLAVVLCCACGPKHKTREQMIAEAYERQRAQEERDRTFVAPPEWQKPEWQKPMDPLQRQMVLEAQREAAEKQGNKFDIWDAAKDFVRSQMKAPSQTSMAEWKIVYEAPPLFFVHVWADSPNAFGVKLRSAWTVAVMVHSQGKKATAISGEQRLLTPEQIRSILAVKKKH